MPTPDLTSYTDLTFYDVTPSDLVERALLDASVKMPDWEPRDGNTEVVLLEALSLIVAEQVYAANRIPSAVASVLLNLFGIAHQDGAAATTTATFALSDTLGHDLPAGTTVRLQLGDDFLDFTTDSAVTAAAGASTVVADLTAVHPTSAANGTPSSTAVTLVSAVPYVDTVTLASDVVGGTDAESDAAWRDRAVQLFARLTDTLVKPAHFQAAALDFATVERAQAIDNYNGTTTAAGHVSVAVLGPGGTLVSSGNKTAIATELGSKAQANLAVHVIDPTITDVDVTAAVHAVPGADTTVVHDAIVAALDAYLSPETWSWAGKVRVNELIALISNVDGVDWVDSLTVPSGDVTLTGAAPLANLDTAAITVTAG